MTDDNVIPFAPPGCRLVWPSDFLMSTDCRVHYILTKGNVLLDAHEREVIRAGTKFRIYGNFSADTLIGSKTARGDLMTLIGFDSGEIEHHWALDN